MRGPMPRDDAACALNFGWAERVSPTAAASEWKSPVMKTQKLAGKALLAGSLSALMLGAVAWGATALVNSTQGEARARTLELESTGTGAKTSASAINWQPSFEAALAQSKVSGKPVMVDFGAKWCGACRMMEEQTYPDAAVIAASNLFEMAKVDVDERQDLANRYGISSLPTTAWLRSDGKPIVGAVGALEAPDLVSSMNEALKRAQTSK